MYLSITATRMTTGTLVSLLTFRRAPSSCSCGCMGTAAGTNGVPPAENIFVRLLESFKVNPFGQKG
jgi:hypothetical protein